MNDFDIEQFSRWWEAKKRRGIVRIVKGGATNLPPASGIDFFDGGGVVSRLIPTTDSGLMLDSSGNGGWQIGTANGAAFAVFFGASRISRFLVNSSGAITKYNTTLTAGLGVPPIFDEGISGVLTANTTLKTFTPPTTAGRYFVGGILTATSGTNTGTFQLTVDYTNSQGQALTGQIIPLTGAAGTIVQTGTAANTEFSSLPKYITIDNSGSNIVIKLVVTGSVNVTASRIILESA